MDPPGNIGDPLSFSSTLKATEQTSPFRLVTLLKGKLSIQTINDIADQKLFLFKVTRYYMSVNRPVLARIPHYTALVTALVVTVSNTLLGYEPHRR